MARLRAGAAAAGLRAACRVPRIRVGFDRRTGAPFGVLSYLRTLPAEFDLRVTNWSSGELDVILSGDYGGLAAKRVRAVSRFNGRFYSLLNGQNIHIVGHSFASLECLTRRTRHR